MIFQNPVERSRFLKFAVVGVIGAIVDFGAFNLLIAFASFDAIWASAVSFSFAVVSNFLWNRYWTYPDSRSKPISRQLVEFTIVSLFGMGIRLVLFALFENEVIRAATKVLSDTFIVDPTFVGHNIMLAIAVLVVMLWNFFANRFWTYGDVKS